MGLHNVREDSISLFSFFNEIMIFTFFYSFIFLRDAMYRQSTGIAWQRCEKLENCSENNKAAVLKRLQEQNAAVSNAVTEISEVSLKTSESWKLV